MNHFIVRLLGIVCLCSMVNPTSAMVFTQTQSVGVAQGISHNLFERLFNKKFTIQSTDSGNFTCKPGHVTVECSYRGTCRYDGKSCACDDGYTTSPNNDQQCDYKQKNTLTAFLLELFLGMFGGGYFYLGLISFAVGQMCLFVIGAIIACLIVCLGVLAESEGCAYILSCCYICLWVSAMIAWWIASLVMIARATILDGNDMPFPSL